MMFDSGGLQLTPSRKGPAWSARTLTKISTLLPIEAGILLAFVDYSLLVRLKCRPIILAPLLEGRLGLRRSRYLGEFVVRLLRTIVGHPACYEGQPRIHNPFIVTSFMPDGLDGDEGRHVLVRHVNEAAREVVLSFILHYPHRSPQDVLFGADRDTQRRRPSFFSNASVEGFKERNFLNCRGVPFRWYYQSWRGSPRCRCCLARAGASKNVPGTAISMLAVTPIRPREMSSVYAKASPPSRWNSFLKRFMHDRNARQNTCPPYSPAAGPQSNRSFGLSRSPRARTHALVSYHST